MCADIGMYIKVKKGTGVMSDQVQIQVGAGVGRRVGDELGTVQHDNKTAELVILNGSASRIGRCQI